MPTAFQNARVHGTADGQRVDIAFGADLVGAGTVRGNIAWPAFGAPSEAFRQPVHGKVAVHMQSLALAQGFTTELDSTSGALDGAIQGDGFFVVRDPSSGAVNYTRAGNFKVDANGNLMTATGEKVQGWIMSNGVLNTNGTIGDIVVPSGTLRAPARG